MSLTLRYYPDPVLRTPARPIRAGEKDVPELAAEMIAMMRISEGVGLAAQQIGETRAICVIEVPADYDRGPDEKPLNPDLPMPLVLLNPEIEPIGDKTESREEGCLSFPGIRGKIERPCEIRLRYRDLDGAPHDLPVRGFAARVIQHEVDHLNGKLFIERMSAAKRLVLKGKLARMRREAGVD